MESSVDIFKKLNEIVFDIIQTSDENKNILELIGFYLYEFFETEDTRINFKVPYYSSELKDLIVDYTQIFDFLYKLCKIKPLKKFDDTVLFDIFQYLKDNKNSRNSNSYFRKFHKSVSEYAYFENHTCAYTKHFLPLFPYESHSISKNFIIFQSFRYFSKISASSLIDYPILINFKKDFSLFLSQKTILQHNLLLADNIVAYEIEDSLENIFEKYESFEIKNIITLKFPYNSNIDSRLQLIESSKKIDITLNYRLSYDEIEPEDFIIIPNEFINNQVDGIFSKVLKTYCIINTFHSQELYLAFKHLNDEWGSHSFNIYNIPYPAKWLMCIHPDENVMFWKALYRNNFPGIPDSIYKKVDKIIDGIYESNWIEKFFRKNTEGHIIFPKSKVLKPAIQSLKSYIVNNFSKIKVVFDENEIQKTNSKYIVFDVFSIIPISNLIQKNSNLNLIIGAPDFLYFSYQPHLKYHIIKYLFDPLLMGARSKLDQNFDTYKSIWLNNTSTLLKQISKEKFEYHKQYVQTVLEEIEETEIEMFDVEIKEFSEAETLLQEHSKKMNYSNNDISVTTKCDKVIKLKGLQKILIKTNGFLVKVNAGEIKEGDFFIPINELNQSIDRDYISVKFSKMPLSGKEWQINLNAKNDINLDLYATLIKRGLSISKSRFEHTYLLKKRNGLELPTNFPKKKQDWNIISSCLDINDLELNQAWISYYGQKDLNKLKSMYIEILEEMINHDTFGESENELFYEIVISSIKSCGFLGVSLDFDYLELAKSIISALSSEIKLYEVQTLKIER